MITKHQKNCPTCNRIIYYKSKKSLYNSLYRKCICKECVKLKYSETSKGRKWTIEQRIKIISSLKNNPIFKQPLKEETKRKLSIALSGQNNPFYDKKHTLENKQKMSNAWKNRPPATKKTRLKISKSQKERFKLHPMSEEEKQKHREKLLKRVKQFGVAGNYNPKACEYFNKLNEEKSWNLQHALNGGEIDCIGYSLDAYDKERNIVVEYDEPHHNLPSIKEKDLIRQNRIINHLKCEFYRFNEKNNTLLLFDNPQ